MPGSAAVGFLALWYSPVLLKGQSPVLPEPLQEPKGIPLSKLPVGTGPEVDSVTLTPTDVPDPKSYNRLNIIDILCFLIKYVATKIIDLI